MSMLIDDNELDAALEAWIKRADFRGSRTHLATQWLREKLGMPPSTLRSRPKRNGAAAADGVPAEQT